MYREGDWKIVKANNEEWQLYNLVEDRTELNNRAKDFPDIITEMNLNYEKWKASLPK